MYVYLHAYQPDAPLAYVTFYRNDAKAFETAPAAADEPLPVRLPTRPLRFSFPLEQLTPGEYLCQVTVLDAKNRKTAFWQTPVMIAP
jgi:hypothetical protein